MHPAIIKKPSLHVIVTFNITAKESKGKKFKTNLESQWNSGKSCYSIKFCVRLQPVMSLIQGLKNIAQSNSIHLEGSFKTYRIKHSKKKKKEKIKIYRGKTALATSCGNTQTHTHTLTPHPQAQTHPHQYLLKPEASVLKLSYWLCTKEPALKGDKKLGFNLLLQEEKHFLSHT